MTGLYQLPVSAVIGGREYPIHADYRDILEIFSYLEDPDPPESLRWQIALALFYEGEIPAADMQEAAQYLASFIAGGESPRQEKKANKLFDWQQDAPAIIADVNKVAGQEIRSQRFIHWWTFLAWFHAIGEGQLSCLVSIRDKLARGKKLEDWEKDFYRQNKARVDLKKRYSATELQEQERLQKMLDS